MKEAGIEPAPERESKMPWKTFLKAHWQAIAATDFFTVEVLTLLGLVRYHVLFVIELNTRRIDIAGITRHATEAWMMQVGRNLIDEVDGFLLNGVVKTGSGSRSMGRVRVLSDIRRRAGFSSLRRPRCCTALPRSKI